MKTGTLISPEEARILVAEDHPLNQMFVRKSLERFGVKTFEIVPNGLEAYKRYSTSPWDIILMDCHMPEMSGYEATKGIRTLEQKTGAHAFIIAMTANTMDGEREKCLECGMDDYIKKPINISELKHALKQCLKFEDDLDVEPKEKAVWNDLAPVDISRLRAFSEGNPATEKQMVRVFLEQSEKNIALIRMQNASKNTLAIKEAAHMFKGGAINIGAVTLSQICDRIEHFSGTSGGRAALIESVEKEFNRVKHYLDELGLLEKQA
jgi:CheY-like chemotaxis protein